ncbi:MAG: type II toxin-antitoxin system VapC family toxin [Actinomycetota bacterium]|nr:type II toxin-antitoxin system VapC family toxin [Actinomycetota bacterium]
MLIPDVNVYIYAHRPESSRHEEFRDWLSEAAVGEETLGVGESILASFVRIVTNHRIYLDPTPPAAALDACEAILGGSSATGVRPGARHWQIFSGLCRTLRARANTVPDVYLAALALENGATFITTDQGFGRFPGLRFRHPLDG